MESGVYWASENSLILDMACGDGRFLIPIIKNILYNYPEENKEKALMNIYGWDTDAQAINECRNKLNQLLEPYPFQIDWNLRCCDALRNNEPQQHYDFIFSNPPYIRQQNLAPEYRSFLLQSYVTCSFGSSDIYLAFFEQAYHLLSDTGICVIITPNSYLTTSAAQHLRDHIRTTRSMVKIINYEAQRLFGSVGTYSAISIFRNQQQNSIRYEVCDSNFRYRETNIPYEYLEIGKAWNMGLTSSPGAIGIRLGDICEISVGITTLSDHLYIVRLIEQAAHLAMIETRQGHRVAIESTLLRPIIKGSKLKCSDDPITEYIIFPYQKNSKGKNKIIPESVLKERFPFAYRYLCSIKADLSLRDKGTPNAVAWYAFGRGQALDHSFGKKIIFSPINKEPNFVLYENPDCTLYSGYFIKTCIDYEALLTQLNSPRMKRYIQQVGRDFLGGYKGYNKKIISDFILDKDFSVPS